MPLFMPWRPANRTPMRCRMRLLRSLGRGRPLARRRPPRWGRWASRTPWRLRTATWRGSMARRAVAVLMAAEASHRPLGRAHGRTWGAAAAFPPLRRGKCRAASWCRHTRRSSGHTCTARTVLSFTSWSARAGAGQGRGVRGESANDARPPQRGARRAAGAGSLDDAAAQLAREHENGDKGCYHGGDEHAWKGAAIELADARIEEGRIALVRLAPLAQHGAVMAPERHLAVVDGDGDAREQDAEGKRSSDHGAERDEHE